MSDIIPACMILAGVSLPISGWINNPLIPITKSFIIGGFLGGIISRYLPIVYHRLLSGSILGISLVTIIMRYFGWFPPPKNTPLIYINQCSEMLDNENRISFTSHQILDNEGPVLFANPLTVDNVMQALKDIESNVDFHVNIHRDIIEGVLKTCDFSDKMSGIFIHGATEGYVLIKGANQNTNRIMSIRI